MHIQAINVKSKFVRRLLEQPNKRHLAVFGHYNALRDAWQKTCAELRQLNGLCLDYRMSHADHTIEAPDGGFIMLMPVVDHRDLDRLKGLEITTFFVEEIDHGSFRNDVIMALKCRVRY